MRASLAVLAALTPFVLEFIILHGFAQQDATKQPETIPLDEVTARLAALDEEWKKQIDTVKKVIDGEEAARRITEATAQSLRWSVRSATITQYDNRSSITSAKVPTDNTALLKVFRETEELLSTQQEKRKQIIPGISKELGRRLSKLVTESGKLADADAVQASIDEIQKTLRGGATEAPDLFYKLQTAEASFGRSSDWLKRRQAEMFPCFKVRLQSCATVRSIAISFRSRIGGNGSKRLSNPIRKRRTKRERH